MSRTVAFTIDVEDPRSDTTREYRVRRNVDLVLEWLAARGHRGTAFVVGSLAEEDPGIVRAFAEGGHEIALHSWTHTPLHRHDPESLTHDLRRGRALLQDLSGQRVDGFRAPIFSLTQKSPWVPRVLTDVGFTYSSSVLPARNPLFGFPDAPRVPFRWDTGLLELPAPVGRVGPLEVPFLGGTYLRVLPKMITRRLLRSHPTDSVCWTYCHPWDFDTGERLARYQETSWPATVLCFAGRRRMFDKLDSVLRDVSVVSLGSVADTLNGGGAPELQGFSIAASSG
jgi:polysaccharide deacetylase family protein (PEP-CTERM system associated)